MSAKHRCKVCRHGPGPRVSGNKGKSGAIKKAGCNHDCHS